jgi:hypothetical protein
MYVARLAGGVDVDVSTIVGMILGKCAGRGLVGVLMSP